ncbi:MAG TPA: head decoration protein [Rickettsiales bacterium]|nr:head decoration protein [Rickettsiales bacterium]
MDETSNLNTSNSTKYDNSPLYYKATTMQDTIVVPADTTFEKGILLGEITASGKLTKFSASATDGSQVPVAVLNREITNNDNSSENADIVASVIILGILNENKIVFDDGVTLDTIVADKGRIRTLLKNNGLLVLSSQNLNNYLN